jgi:hypothetical protein
MATQGKDLSQQGRRVMMSDGTPSAPGLASGLLHEFLRYTRGANIAKLTTNGLFDIGKISEVLAREGFPPPKFSVISAEEASESINDILSDRRCQISAPRNNDHYIFDTALHAYGLRAYQFSNVDLCFNIERYGRPEFYLFTQDQKLIDGMFFGANPFWQEPELFITGSSAFVDDFFPKYNICHFLFDKFPRAFIAKKYFETNIALLFHTGPYYEEISKRGGVEFMPLIRQRVRRGSVRLKSCVFFTNSFHRLSHPAQLGSPLHLEALNSLRLVSSSVKGRSRPGRYMITRAGNLPRRIENIDAVLAMLDRHGVLTGDPGALTPNEQIGLFSNLELVVGVHGAGLTNLVFQPPGSAVLELLPPLCATKAYWIAAEALGLRYHHLVCDDPEYGTVDARSVSHNAANNRRNVVVPIEKFELVLRDSICQS